MYRIKYRETFCNVEGGFNINHSCRLSQHPSAIGDAYVNLQAAKSEKENQFQQLGRQSSLATENWILLENMPSDQRYIPKTNLFAVNKIRFQHQRVHLHLLNIVETKLHNMLRRINDLRILSQADNFGLWHFWGNFKKRLDKKKLCKWET
jgi:hypothetical protein